MEALGYYDGRIGPLDEMLIPMNDRSCYFGDGIYDAALCANRIIFALDEHVDRFFSGAALLKIPLEKTREEVMDLLNSLIIKTDSPDLLVYFQLTRGAGRRAHVFPENNSSRLWVTLTPAKPVDCYVKIRLITVEDTRFLHCNIKTLNLLPNVLASEQAKQAGCSEAVFHRGSRVTECAHSNVHILKDGVFRTAPTDNLILPGISRKHLLNHCKTLGIPVKEEAFTVDQMMDADEVIISSCGSLCVSANYIDNTPVGGRSPELLRRLQDAVVEEFRSVTGTMSPKI
jgi:D-alanine transaminase